MQVTDSSITISISGSQLYPAGAGFSLASPIRVDETWQSGVTPLPASGSPDIQALQNATRRITLPMACVGTLPDTLEAALDFAAAMSEASGRIDMAFPGTGRFLAGDQAAVSGWQISPDSGLTLIGVDVLCGLHHSTTVVLPTLENGYVEIVTDGGAKYMEFVFKLPPGWDGQADAGYLDDPVNPTMIIFIEHTIDIVTWAQGVFFDSPTAWTTDTFGWSVVRARSMYVQDVQVKSGDLIWKFYLNLISGDFATLTDGFFDGAEMALSYPYNLNFNAQRAALQTDLRALGYTGATVSLASSVVTITLPAVTLSGGFGSGAYFFTDPRPYLDLWGRTEYTNQMGASLTSASSPGYEYRSDVHQFCRLRASAPLN